jgi:competence protein ComEC
VRGFVETREQRERSDRIVVAVARYEAPRTARAPARVRVTVKKGTAPAVGAFVAFKAHLSPPLQPLRPGGYDFARDMYFQRIGASGYVLGKIRLEPAPSAQGSRLRFMALVDAMRETINTRIHALLPGDRGSIASALVTGKRNAISAPVADAFYISSLAHVLAISGFHMAVVAGIAFFVIRAGLALIPSLSLRRPIKKWAAAGALATATYYLVLSGASVSTQRSFIMIAIVLIGVLLDRPTLTLRTIAIAAVGVLLFTPEAVVHPSFQMSFSATLALIACYRYGLPWKADKDTPVAVRVALWGAREVVGIMMASFVAGLATEPYAAYHFHRIAPYGVLANLLAMPVVSAFVMPMGILGVIALPFGFDAPFWHLMGHGIDWMIAVVLWVAHLPGAVGHMPAFGTGPLLVATLAILLLCLLRTPLRWSGAVFGVIACIWAAGTPRPDLLVSADGQAAAFRGADGRLSVLHSGRDSFVVKEWLAADGDTRLPTDTSLATGARCDAIGCIGALKNGRLVSMVFEPEAFEEDCARAAIVISARPAQMPCRALLVDRPAWQAHGAVALRWTGDHFDETPARPPGSDRPWASAPHIPPTTMAPPDATPSLQDMEAGD